MLLGVIGGVSLLVKEAKFFPPSLQASDTGLMELNKEYSLGVQIKTVAEILANAII